MVPLNTTVVMEPFYTKTTALPMLDRMILKKVANDVKVEPGTGTGTGIVQRALTEASDAKYIFFTLNQIIN
jgi:hypothetical protein